ncbi:dienelactone hydrolase family protein [Actinoplanes sp. L3-i22]|uniref:dienelactone hydrolase family protein n=1 Tax=Actinoplanes sp. L3-i22 TaxID=2836373 RepID=UPI001C76E6A0|nr:dienelactone hydrolase family protein [Actinoplanes sp. L3-i22]BCY10328.1 hypothetical protein L3i22_054160 [Actinoplanes sp. L3-i22]
MREELFAVGDVPVALWAPETPDENRPVILLGHGGGFHKTAPEMVALATRLVAEGGFTVVCPDVPGHGDRPVDEELNRIATANQTRIEAGADIATILAEFHALVALTTVREWRSVLDFVGARRAGYRGVSLGCGLGVPFVAAEPRVRAAVLGLGSGLASREAAAAITAPVEFLLQWDDERVPREHALALFDAFGSAGKTLHANPGKHGDLPDHEIDSTIRFFRRHL